MLIGDTFRSNWNLECWFLRRGENRSTRRKTSRSKERTNNKLNPHMTPGPSIEPGSHWWEASALTTTPLHHPCSNSNVIDSGKLYLYVIKCTTSLLLSFSCWFNSLFSHEKVIKRNKRLKPRSTSTSLRFHHDLILQFSRYIFFAFFPLYRKYKWLPTAHTNMKSLPPYFGVLISDS